MLLQTWCDKTKVFIVFFTNITQIMNMGGRGSSARRRESPRSLQVELSWALTIIKIFLCLILIKLSMWTCGGECRCNLGKDVVMKSFF